MNLVKLALMCVIPSLTLAQSKEYDVVLGYGLYVAPAFKHSHSKSYLMADFSYNLSQRWTITSGFTSGQFNYYDDVRSNAFMEPTKYTTATTNARGFDFHAYLLATYAIIKTSRFYLQTGLGVGMLTRRLKYPYREPCSSGCNVFIGEQSSTNLELPIKAEAYYLISNRISLGLTAGGFVNTESSITGIHLGPHIRIGL